MDEDKVGGLVTLACGMTSPRHGPTTLLPAYFGGGAVYR